jgi:hypothetical protein
MPGQIVEPTVEVNGDETITRHPAFGQIGAFRVSGGAHLYGSDFNHHAFMMVRICMSSHRRSLSQDWHYGEQEIIEVAMSEAQWATFVSAPNIGSGVPCTIRSRDGKYVADMPPPEDRTKQFADEAKKTLAASIQEIKSAIAYIDDMKLPKKTAEQIKGRLNHALTHLNSNVPFVAQSFGEHMENTVEKAKCEVHGYMTNVLQRSGLAAVLGAMPPLLIEADSHD